MQENEGNTSLHATLSHASEVAEHPCTKTRHFPTVADMNLNMGSHEPWMLTAVLNKRQHLGSCCPSFCGHGWPIGVAFRWWMFQCHIFYTSAELLHWVVCLATTNTIYQCHNLLQIPLPSYPLTSVGTPSATALLQHGIQILLPSNIVPPYAASSATSSLTS